MRSNHAAKYDRIGQAYYDAAAMTRQEFDTAIQRAQKELQGMEERRKAREIKEREVLTGVERRQKTARPKGTVTRLFGRAGKRTPTVKSIRGAY